MTGRQVAEAAFKNQPAPRPAVTLIGGGSWYVNMIGQTFSRIKNDPTVLARYSIEAVKRFGHDMLWCGSGLINYPFSLLGAKIIDDSVNPPALEGAAIDSLDQLGSLDMDKILADPLMEGILESDHLVADAVGKEALILPTQWGPFTAAARVLGAEKFMMSTAMQPDKAKELISFCTEMIWAFAERRMDHPDVPGINLAEPVASGDMISPKMFRELAAPSIKELVRRCRDKGKYLMVHICGNTTGVLDDIVDIDPDCFSLEAKVDLRTAQEKLGGKVCVAGQVSPVGAFMSGSPEEVKAEAQGCLDAWGDNPGFMLTLGCDFAASAPEENLDAIMSFKK